jgi:hypothetical protein
MMNASPAMCVMTLYAVVAEGITGNVIALDPTRKM